MPSIDGEVVGYLGPNGSGKTTTTRILTGLLEPTSGAVLFDGRETRLDPIEFRRRLGYVPEEPHLYPFLSGREHLELVGRLREMPPASMDRKIARSPRAVRAVGCRGAGDRVLFKGDEAEDSHHRRAPARSGLLIFDEPDSGLDVTAALVLRHLVANLAARGKAILYTSHILDVVERLCTRVIVLHEGRVVADDSVQHLRTAGEQLARTGLRAPGPAPGSRADRAGHRRRGDRWRLIVI